MVVWGIGSQDSHDDLVSFRDQMGLTFPVLHDPNGQVHEDYAQQHAFAQTIYPQDWIVGVDGTIVYVNNAYEVDAMRAILDDQLAQSSQ